MPAAISAILPVFAIALLGWACGRRGLFQGEQLRALASFVLNLALPALVFTALARQPAAAVLRPDFLLVYAIASILLLAGGQAWFRTRRNLPLPAASVRALGMAGANTGLIGLPVLINYFGPIAVAPVALAMIVENLLIIPAVLIACGGRAEEGGLRAAAWTAFRGVVRTPLFLAIVAGLGVSLLGLALPEMVHKSIDMLGRASAAAALIFIGATIAHGRRTADRKGLAVIIIAKLAIHPALVLGLALLAQLADGPLRTGMIVLAAMPMMSVVPILAQRYDEDAAFLSGALVWQTVLAAVTIPLWFWIAG